MVRTRCEIAPARARFPRRLPVFLRLWLGLLLGLSWLAGCNEPTAELRAAVELLSAEQGEVAERAQESIQRHGPAALPYLESALHRAAAPGRRNIVIALRRLGLAQSAPLLGHIAAFDADAAVRAEAYRTLENWSAHRLPTALAALRQADEARTAP